MPCTVKKTFETALATDNHLLVQLKTNQRALHRAVGRITAENRPADTAFSRAAGRSRQEDRTVEIFHVGDGLADSEWGPFIKTIIRVTRRTLLRSAATGLWEERNQSSYYVSSAIDLSATAWGAAIRGHWAIENRNHYVRDVSCDEDKSRIRQNPGVMARARSFALNIMRKNGVTNVARALWSGALSLDHILNYKGI